MRTRVALLAALLVAFLALWAARGERAAVPKARERSSDSAEVSKSALVALQDSLEPPQEGSSARTALGGAARESDEERRLSVRVIDAETRATLRECWAWLEFPDVDPGEAEELPDGSFEFRGPILPGTEVVVEVPEGWEVVPDRIELDVVPEDELVFVAHPVSMGPVHGMVVDELDGRPLPFQRIDGDGEDLVTDVQGGFHGVEFHPRGTLEFRAGDWSYDLGGWDPERDEPVVVPARVGPTIFLELDRTPEKPWALWTSEAPPESATAVGLNVGNGLGVSSRRARLDLQPMPRAQLPWDPSLPASSGELRVGSYPDFLFGRARLDSGLGSVDAPLRIALRSCGILVVRTDFSRTLTEQEAGSLSFALLDGEHEALTSFVPGADCGFFVLEAGERRLEVRLDERTVASATVTAKLLEVVQVQLAVPLPMTDPEPARNEEPGPAPRHSVTARVTSARNHHYPAHLSLMRISDGEETQADVKWTKENGRWLGRVDDRALGGAHRVQLELEPAFDWGGPRTLEFPHAGELRFTIDDTAPLVDVYLRPVAAEDGRPLLSFDGEAFIESGDGIGGDDFLSPSVPMVRGHPRTVPFDWVCSAPGRRPACGSFEPDGGEGDIVIPVVLERGWGLRLYVGDNSHSGLPGVRVFADGVPMGLTSRSGILCLGGERPQRLSFVYEDWRVDPWGDVDPDGSFEDQAWGLSVFLAPPERR